MTTITQLESRIDSLEEKLTKLSATKNTSDVYAMTDAEQAGVQRGLKQSEARQFASVREVAAMYARCGVSN